MIASAPDAPATKFCNGCLQARPITGFGRHRRGEDRRRARSNPCKNREEQQRSARRRAKANGLKITAATVRLKNAASLEEYQFVVGVMIENFGGCENLLLEWSKALSASAIGSKRHLDFYAAIFRATELAQPEPLPDDMTEEDLRRAMLENLEPAIQENPQLAAGILERAGWSVSPPA